MRMAITSVLAASKVTEFCATGALDMPMYKMSSGLSTIHIYG